MTSPLRVGILGIVIIALFSILGIRLWTMQVTEAQAYETRAEGNQVRVVRTPAPRGDIWTSNGVKLAGTRSALAAVIDLALIDPEELGPLSQNLAAFLDEPASDIEELLSATNRGSQITVARDITDSQATFLLEHREMFPGINIIPQPVRTYPEGEIAAQVIGYIGKPNEKDLERDDINGEDVLGKAGVENTYDVFLQGTPGIVEYKVDAKRKVLSLENEVPPAAGGSLVLTIDSDVQAQLQISLENGLMQARRLEMEERRLAVEEQSRRSRVAEALRDARSEALQQALDEKAALDAATESGETTTTTHPDEGDERRSGPVEVDESEVLAALYSGLPIDADGICVPVQRVTVPLGGSATVTGVDPRLARFVSVSEIDGELIADVIVEGRSYQVGNGDSFAGTLKVLEVTDDELILNHSDTWCPVRAVGVVLDPNDGSVIAMSAYPTFDPSAFVDGLSTEQWASLGTVSAFTNFAIQGQYAPASTFKTVPYVLALEEDFYPIDRGVGDKEIGQEATGDPTTDSVPDGSSTTTLSGEAEAEPPKEDVLEPLLSDTDEYSCTGEFRFRLNDGTFQTKRDWKWPGGHGPLDLHGALQASCDLYFWDVALRLWNERGDDSGIDKENLLQEYARDFGFGAPTGIDLPFERDGLVPDRAWFISEQREGSPRVRQDGSWVGGDLMDFAVGQGAMLATPLQMANGLSAMINGGTLWEPRVVQSVVDQDGNVIVENTPEILNEIDLSPQTPQFLLADMQQVVNNQERGTARSAFADFGPGVELIGGKTGTGEIIKAPRAEHYRQVDSAYFIGVVPINDPQYVMSVVVERGGSGGRVAAPVARQVFQFLLNGPEGVTPIAPGLDAD